MTRLVMKWLAFHLLIGGTLGVCYYLEYKAKRDNKIGSPLVPLTEAMAWLVLGLTWLFQGLNIIGRSILSDFMAGIFAADTQEV